jgi:Cys-rich protein (TIGR01571 family)
MIFVLAFFWVPVLGWILVFGFYAIVVVLIGSNVRAYMRQKYKIPARLPFRCGQYIDDLFFMLFCGCCSTIQMARHTHDDKDYPGHGCTTTGLGPDAPEIV